MPAKAIFRIFIFSTLGTNGLSQSDWGQFILLGQGQK